MQKSLYQLHQNPQTLHGYSQRWRIPQEALRMLRKDPRNLQLEQQIAHDPEMSMIYAILHLNGDRFELGEPAIMQSPEPAYRYAKHILKRPWPEAEPYIKTSEFFWKLYKRLF